MVAILSPGKSIRNIFYYNENKIKEGVAELIHAENYPVPLIELGEQMRLKMLQKLSAQSTAQVNSLHITLNFAPSENLSKEKLTEIAREYMDKIGFGNQPYLIYQHFDAGHPHIHLVTTNILINGERIDLHHLGIRKSGPARKELESKYNLVKAEDQKSEKYQLKSAFSPLVVYGRSESRRAIGNVLNAVLQTYHYGSLPELNALLGQYNIKADRGAEGSRTFKNNGLLYRILDNQGNPIGVPLKASIFYQKPTLKFLEECFTKGIKAKLPFKNRIKNAIDLAFRSPDTNSLQRLIDELKNAGIHTVIRTNDQGIIYGITYIDHKNKTVFNGSDIGKDYGAKGILDRFMPEKSKPKINSTDQQLDQNGRKQDKNSHLVSSNIQVFLPSQTSTATNLLEDLLAPEHTSDYLPYALTGKKKRKKKRKSTNN